MEYILSAKSQHRLPISLEEYVAFVDKVVTSNNLKMLQFACSHSQLIDQCFAIREKEEGEEVSLMGEVTKCVFRNMRNIREKLLTYCLLQLDIDWLDYLDH